MRKFIYLFLLPIAVFLTIAFPIRGQEQPQTEDMKVAFEAEHPEEMFVLKNTAEEHMPVGHKTTEMQFPKEDSVSPLLIPTSYLLFALVVIAVARKLVRKRV